MKKLIFIAALTVATVAFAPGSASAQVGNPYSSNNVSPYYSTSYFGIYPSGSYLTNSGSVVPNGGNINRAYSGYYPSRYQEYGNRYAYPTGGYGYRVGGLRSRIGGLGRFNTVNRSNQ